MRGEEGKGGKCGENRMCYDVGEAGWSKEGRVQRGHRLFF